MILESVDRIVKSEELLSVPKKEDGERAERTCVSYCNKSQKYVLWGSKDVTRQYFKMYAARLEKMRPVVEARATSLWGK